MSLSGGQKARSERYNLFLSLFLRLLNHVVYRNRIIVLCRVALARAVYAPTKFVLLDDPLSAVVSQTDVIQNAERTSADYLFFFCYSGQSHGPVLIRAPTSGTADERPYGGTS